MRRNFVDARLSCPSFGSKQPCIAVTGTIVDATNDKKADGVRHEADGDTHGWLKLDPGFEDLLNPGNDSSFARTGSSMPSPPSAVPSMF
jgi:hypothetical protein